MVPIVGYEVTLNDNPFLDISLSIFCSGCINNCKGCHNEHLQDPRYGESTSTTTILSEIEKRKELIESVVFLGGDWINYQEDLFIIIKYIKTQLNSHCNAILYTGNLINDIKVNVLNYIDIVIDGKYDNTKLNSLPFPASTNQRVFIQKEGMFTNVPFTSLPINQQEN